MNELKISRNGIFGKLFHIWIFVNTLARFFLPMTNRLWGSGQTAFRQTIRQIRKQAGLTQVQMAEKLKKPQSYVSKYENGERRLDYLEVKGICACCGITIAEFDGFLTKPQKQAGYPTDNPL